MDFFRNLKFRIDLMGSFAALALGSITQQIGSIESAVNIMRGYVSGKHSPGVEGIAEQLVKVKTASAIMDTLDTMVCVTDLDYNILYANRSLSEFFEFDIDRCIGRKCYEMLFKLDEPCQHCIYQQLLPDRDSYPSRETKYILDEQRNMWFSRRSSIIRWTDGSQAMLTSINDVTVKKKYEDRLQDAAKSAEEASMTKTAFLAIMSHEMRTPLNAIIGLTELMLDEYHENGEQKNIEKIHIAGNTLLGIVNDILDISKVESGKLTLLTDEYELPNLLNDVISLNIHRIESKPVSFYIEINESLPALLCGDEIRIKQMLNNLLSNAFKYTMRGTVTLTVDHELINGSEVWLSFTVTDTGIGIRKEDIEKLFTEYYQADSIANRKIEGTGLGLAITKMLAEAMDGSISVESEFGNGSAFCTRIRQGAVNNTTIGPETVESLQNFSYALDYQKMPGKIVRPDLSHVSALVVDDYSTNADIVESMLNKYKIRVDCLSSGQAAVDRIRLGSPQYSIVFMDHIMPGLDGIEATHLIRAIDTEYARTVPVIALTANATMGNEQVFLNNGFQAFLSKPLNISTLDSVIRKWIIKDKKEQEPTLGSREKEYEEHMQEDEQLINIPGIDVDAVLSLYSGEMDLFLSALRSYVSNIPSAADKLRDITEETLPAYSVHVHGLKGASASIGAVDLKEKASTLEQLSRAGDLPGVEALNAELVQNAESLAADIQDWLDKCGLYVK